ncbi:hypothetical protein [Methylobrevis pamukkalensis]|uniref:Uncharacterized protein n=1 Tax=Methylobrevis pamukkalensis TaxID=1439726 RepID=A0A1E3H7X9_9HYPH|nr:hypothetical protein [Methylobrevis pamukkalensis]ODN72437.1 hypothetical protein A6302_00183 [Methylobrevis pamukkalensis]
MALFAVETANDGCNGPAFPDLALVDAIRRFDADLAELFSGIVERIDSVERERAGISEQLLAELKTQRVMFREEILGMIDARRRAA